MTHFSLPPGSKFLSGKNLATLDVQIEWDGEALTTDPNGIAEMAYSGSYTMGRPFIGKACALSGAPAYLYRADNFEIPLAPAVLDRFLRHDLKPKEFKKLHNLLGKAIFETHDDFYDEESGESIQPMRAGRGLKTFLGMASASLEQQIIESEIPAKKEAAKKAKPL